MGQADGLVTGEPGIYLFMRFADCVPLLCFDPVSRAVGLTHAGWRGLLKNAAGATVEAMVNRLGCRPENIISLIGPSIGPCCYEVGPNVIEAASRVFANSDTLFKPATKRNGFSESKFARPGLSRTLRSHPGQIGDFSQTTFGIPSEQNGDILGLEKNGLDQTPRAHFDMWEANRRQLTQAGVRYIIQTGLCTACHTHEFFSHRAEKGRTGRFGVLIGIEANRP
jgi:copper oxidase (laccase) domain-containing protein